MGVETGDWVELDWWGVLRLSNSVEGSAVPGRCGSKTTVGSIAHLFVSELKLVGVFRDGGDITFAVDVDGSSEAFKT